MLNSSTKEERMSNTHKGRAMMNRIGKWQMLSLFVFIAVTVGAGHRLAAQTIVEPGLDNGFVEPQDPHAPQFGGWYLGVYGNYTPRGLHLTQVYPGTAAANVGLEVGDRIVAVNGHRISMHYPLNVALQSTISGWVQLLVQDWRTNRLLYMNVRLTRGRIHY
jgi:predicted metalloprotease with PDZ domain